MRYVMVWISACAMAFLSACGNVFCETRSDLVVEHTRTVDAFDKISLATYGTVHLSVDNTAEPTIEVVAPDHIVAALVTEVQDGWLGIRKTPQRTCISLSRDPSLEIHVTTHHVSEIRLASSGTVQTTAPLESEGLNLWSGGSGTLDLELEGGSLRTTSAGSGSILYSGAVTEHTLVLSDSGDVDALELITDQTTAGIIGSGRAAVHATGILDVTMEGSGTLLYRGNPELTRSGTGSGDIKPAH